MLPAFYVYSRGVEDVRYIFQIFPIISIFSIFTIQKIEKKFTNSKMLVIILLIGLVITTLGFLQYKAIDYEHEREALGIAYHIYDITGGFVNDYYPELQYLNFVKYSQVDFPVLTTSPPLPSLTVITKYDFNSINEYIQYGKTVGLTYLVLDGKNARPSILNDIFYNEDKYPYLVKVFDSLEHDYKYHVKIFKIDYQIFQKI